jgi:uncharacterized protein YutE (UPF0331/DUF86 family)
VVRAEVLRRCLGKLDEYLAILRVLRRYTLEEFVANPEHYGSAERFLQLAIETLIDLGNHVITDLRLGDGRLVQRHPALAVRGGLHRS